LLGNVAPFNVVSSQNLIALGKCPSGPVNTYIAGGDPGKLPFDPSYKSIGETEAPYAYASDGQTYALVTRHYEGSAPNGYQFTSADPYWVMATIWNSTPGYWNNQYVLHQPTK
jgi:hypothetical protein